MRKSLNALLVLACLCLPASAQTTDACRAELRHLTLPSTAQVNDGNGETPLEFLFTDHGADIYAAIPSREPNYMSWIVNNGMRFIVVYQDDQARQQAIHNLIQPNVVADIMAGSSPHGTLDNLKFAVVHLGLGASASHEKDVPFPGEHSAQEKLYHDLTTGSGGWHIEGIEYYEPQSCATPKLEFCTKVSGQIVPCVLPGLHANPAEPNWITDLNVNGRLEPYGDPQFVRIVEAMRGKLKDFIDQNKSVEAPLETTMGSSQPGPLEAYAAKFIESYAPCADSTQHLQVPDGIHSALPGQEFSFMFSQDGVDVYAIRAGNPPKYTRSALLVFQEENARREYLRSFIGTGSISWYPSDSTGSHQDWKPVMSFKYATFDYNWFGDGSHPMLDHASFYAPLDCYSRRTSVGALTRNELGVYMKPAGDTLDARNGVLYRAAIELKKLETKKPDH